MNLFRLEHTWALLLPGAVNLTADSFNSSGAWYAASLAATGLLGAWQGWRISAQGESRLIGTILGSLAALALAHSIAHAEMRGCCATAR